MKRTPLGNVAYSNYQDYTVRYDKTTYEFFAYHKKKEYANCKIEGLLIDGVVTPLSDFPYVFVHQFHSEKAAPDFDSNFSYIEVDIYDHVPVTGEYGDSEEAPTHSILLCVSNYDIAVKSKLDSGAVIVLSGKLLHDVKDEEDVFAVCLDREITDVRAGIGKAVTTIDNAIYFRKTDTAFVAGEPKKTKLFYDKASSEYRFNASATFGSGFSMSVKENVLANKYNIKFNPVRRDKVFKKPSAGWMTWYAVKFDASEETVLENARWLAENLKDFGADSIWVDWEWYHDKLHCNNREDGVNSLMCDPVKYPHGMKYVADKIHELGLAAAIWVGYTNEPCKNKYIEKYPDIVLCDHPSWCGNYYYDYSNPHYLNEYLPEALENIKKWGYDAIKFDLLPISLAMHDMYHDRMYDPTLTTYEAFRNVLIKTREVLGEDMYMLSCSGSFQSTILWASDLFDAARIGDDIFSWEENLKNIIRIMEFYPLHNVQLHADPDNVVIREEFNNIEQAKSRAALISLLGLPFTFGDDFKVLDEARVDILKRSLPVIPMHPMDTNFGIFNMENLIINLSVAKDYESYLVSGIFNMKETDDKRTVDIDTDLHLEDGSYLVYDFYRDSFLGITDKALNLDFLPYEARVLALRPYLGRPQLLSTSRHITQGAAEITDMSYNNGTISITSELVANDRYTVSLYVPDGYSFKSQTGFDSVKADGNILRLTFTPEKTEKYSFTISFDKK